MMKTRRTKLDSEEGVKRSQNISEDWVSASLSITQIMAKYQLSRRMIYTLIQKHLTPEQYQQGRLERYIKNLNK